MSHDRSFYSEFSEGPWEKIMGFFLPSRFCPFLMSKPFLSVLLVCCVCECYVFLSQICDDVNAILMADMAHISGLVATGVSKPHPHQLNHTPFTLLFHTAPSQPIWACRCRHYHHTQDTEGPEVRGHLLSSRGKGCGQREGGPLWLWEEDQHSCVSRVTGWPSQ